ncbi:hypothetical protein [Fervidobacterium thailandense]|uniref:Oligosaccharide repeat unit polymerase n=1 Tax=Fervidobacterium thailandense TaxID=1008305 RepID=A0A1E3G0P6_9BACT|nr:hypothetical protein [Fervidobacterium thailandense]ODN29819.1 hypothetical protein A4H02_08685 [Fervidobacterium thailandense]
MLISISVMFILLSIVAEIYFLKTGPFVRLMNIPNLIYIYLLRPMAILSIGTSILYSREFDIQSYKLGWFLASLYIISENIGYLFTFPRLSKMVGNNGVISEVSVGFQDYEAHQEEILRVIKSSIFWLVMFSTTFLLTMFLTAGTSFLAQNRNMAMAAVNPLLRYIYPFVQLSAAVLAFSAVILIFSYKRLFFGVSTLIVSLVITSIIYQRGMTTGFLVLAGTVAFDLYRLRRGKISLKLLLRYLIVLLFLFILLVFLRDIYNLFVTGQFNLFKSLQKSEFDNLNMFFLILSSRPDGDVLEIWSILLRFLSRNGPLLGETLIRAPLMLMSSNFRLKTGMKTGVDILNEYYDFNTYWFRKFGFNVNAAQELVLNFHFISALYGFFVGALNGLLVRWYYKRLRKGEFIKSTIYFSAVSYFLTTFAAFQWMIFEIIFAEILSLLLKIKLRTSRNGTIVFET